MGAHIKGTLVHWNRKNRTRVASADYPLDLAMLRYAKGDDATMQLTR